MGIAGSTHKIKNGIVLGGQVHTPVFDQFDVNAVAGRCGYSRCQREPMAILPDLMTVLVLVGSKSRDVTLIYRVTVAVQAYIWR